MGWIVGCDTGGTFTDFFAVGETGEARVTKVPSTPPTFALGGVEGLKALGIAPADVDTLFHGTTVTTNAVITKRGAPSALVTTEGFRDVLEIRRANREELYDILWDPPAPLIPRRHRLEVVERVYPVLTHHYAFIQDSPGAGRHRGGLGVTRDFELTHGDATLSVLGSRGVVPVWGGEGGLPALGSGLIHDWNGPDELEIGVMRSGVHARQGKTIRFWEGGGGWQDPKTRPPEWVLEDVIDEFVSIEAARELYGVEVRCVDADAALYEIDVEATARLCS